MSSALAWDVAGADGLGVAIGFAAGICVGLDVGVSADAGELAPNRNIKATEIATETRICYRLNFPVIFCPPFESLLIAIEKLTAMLANQASATISDRSGSPRPIAWH